MCSSLSFPVAQRGRELPLIEHSPPTRLYNHTDTAGTNKRTRYETLGTGWAGATESAAKCGNSSPVRCSSLVGQRESLFSCDWPRRLVQVPSVLPFSSPCESRLSPGGRVCSSLSSQLLKGGERGRSASNPPHFPFEPWQRRSNRTSPPEMAPQPPTRHSSSSSSKPLRSMSTKSASISSVSAPATCVSICRVWARRSRIYARYESECQRPAHWISSPGTRIHASAVAPPILKLCAP